MIIKDANSFCYVENLDDTEKRQLYDLLRIEDDGKYYSPAYKSGRWDGYHSFYDKKKDRFPAGLLHAVLKRFPYADYQKLHRSSVLRPHTSLGTLTPREDQLAIIEAALKERRGLIQAPTSFGKTVCLAMLCKAIPGEILIVTHTRSLLHQTAKSLARELGEPIGLVGDGYANRERVTIGLVKSLAEYDFSKVNALLADEVHRFSADMLFKLALSIPAYYRFGLSADPLDEQDVKSNSLYKRFRIMSCFGPIIAKSTMDEAKERGVIADPIITIKRIPDPHNGLHHDSDYQTAYEELVVNNPNLSTEIQNLCKTFAGQQVMILLRRVDQGRELAKLIPNSRFLWGELSTDVIQKGIDDFKAGKYSVMIGSDIFKEGIDIPEIDVLINAGSDVAATKQRLGRGLRKRPGKDTIDVFDFLICGNKYTEKHAKERLRIYLGEGHTVNGYKSPNR